ncbi:MAG: PAS domain S-box protein [bacterium]
MPDNKEIENLKKTLSEVETLYWSIMKASPDDITITDIHGRILSASKSALVMFGYEEQELLGRTLTDFIAVKDRKRGESNFALMQEGKLTGLGEYLGVRKNGKTFDIEVNGEFVQDRNGKSTKMIFIVRDITKRRDSEKIIKEAGEYLNNIVNAVADPIFVKDANYRFVLTNDALSKMLGINKKDIIGKTLAESLPKDQMKHFLEVDKMVLDTGTEKTSEEYLTGKNGKRLTIVTKKSRHIDSYGNKFLVGVIHDITDRRKIEKALKESEEKYRTIFEQSPIAIEVYDQDGKLVNVNPSFLELFGVRKIEEINNFPLFDDPNISDKHKKDLRLGKMIHYEALFDFEKVKKRKLFTTTKSGQISVEVLITPTSSSDKSITGYLVQVQDKTERKELENKLVALALRDSLTGLYSRHYYEEEIARLKESRHFPVSVIYIDIDNLNHVNNTLGHNQGDKILKRASSVIGSDFRTEDNISRVGGDEFVVLIPDTDEKTVIKIVERIKKSLREHNIKIPDPILSFSMGYATALTNDQLEKSIQLADKRMYVEKNSKKLKRRY